MSSCQKVESVVGSGASKIRSATDVVIIAQVLQRCSQFVSTHNQARSLMAFSRGVDRNCWRDVFTFPPSSPFPSRPFPYLPYPYTSPSISFLSLLLPLKVRSPSNQLGVLGERSKLPQLDRGQSPGRKRIWCTLELTESHGGNHFEYLEEHVLFYVE